MSTLTIEKKAYFWNTLSGIVNAVQSFLFIIVIGRACGLVEAGIFSIAYANANLFLTIGKWGMRQYQATDLQERFIFPEYLYSRFFSTGCMVLSFGIYLIYNNIVNPYSMYKLWIVIGIFGLKVIDSIEDVYSGMSQQRNRLDVGAKSNSLRNIAVIIALILTVYLFRNLLIATICACIVSVLFFGFQIKYVFLPLQKKSGRNWNYIQIRQLLLENLPLVIANFCGFYMLNAPKYTIDRYLSEEMQAYYGYLSMPVLVISLFKDFIFVPLIVKFAEYWKKEDIQSFIKLMLKQISMVLLFSGLIILGGYVLGIPIMSFLFHTDLSPYKLELCLLLMGGCFTAIHGLFYILIIVIRRQKWVTPIYITFVIVIAILSPYSIKYQGFLGAILLYLLISIALTGVLGFVIFHFILQKLKSRKVMIKK